MYGSISSTIMATVKTQKPQVKVAKAKIFNIRKEVAPRTEDERVLGGVLSDYLDGAESTSISRSVKDINSTSKVTLKINYGVNENGNEETALLFISGPLSKELRAKTITISDMIDFPVQLFNPRDQFGNPVVNAETGELEEIYVICRPEGQSRIDVVVSKAKASSNLENEMW